MDDYEKNNGYKLATFGGGCFWCMVQPFEETEGVVEVLSGYSGGALENPTYDEVSTGTTGHIEVVQIKYDPKTVNYGDLLQIFWKQIDPTDPGGQFADRGSQYETVIFYHDGEQKKIAEASLVSLENSGMFSRPIATKILKAKKFYPTEEHHQCYYRKNPAHYGIYKKGSGREEYIEKVWSKHSKGGG
ncbi:MAG: peptide-methionine (S)-S-oxide reductase MsrA [Clostridia bacterium]|nr:peptide-methionine (S)-S-oxide reductase MsrA [Clostridia bacterium]